MENRVINPFMLCDGYKTSHVSMYPEGTEFVTCNFTPRSLKHAGGIKSIVVFGLQMAMREIHEIFEEGFFTLGSIAAVEPLKVAYSTYLNMDYDTSHIHQLHNLGYLPLKIKTLAEGTIINPGIPVLTVTNTVPEFYWLPNFIETLLSTLMWKPMISASTAYQFRQLLNKWCIQTDMENMHSVWYQAHDFSMRGMDSVYAAMSSGLGHLTSFRGTDTLPTIYAAEQYYDNPKADPTLAGTVPASEHSVMSAGADYNEGIASELSNYRRLLKVYPKGILSLVSDTFNLWDIITVTLPQLKDEIMARPGKLVIRPDSGDPVDIICGKNPEFNKPEWGNSEKDKGVIELLWNVFGGTTNEQGYKVLDSHIGAIYGDSITYERAAEICKRLENKGFASTNIILGIGSYTYQYNTRDTLGLAMKATHCIIDGKDKDIFKNPITDDGTKKSAKGRLSVKKVNVDTDGAYEIKAYDQQNHEEASRGMLRTIYEDGFRMNQVRIETIRMKIESETKRLDKLKLREQGEEKVTLV